MAPSALPSPLGHGTTARGTPPGMSPTFGRGGSTTSPPPPMTWWSTEMLCVLHRHCGRLGYCRFAPWAALALGYFTLMQQSNLLSPALGGWGGPHTIRRRDVAPAPSSLWVTIASSKTLKKRAQAVALFVPTIPGSPYCFVVAWARALRQLPANSPQPSGRPSATPASPMPRATPSTVSAGVPPRPARHRAWTSVP